MFPISPLYHLGHHLLLLPLLLPPSLAIHSNVFDVRSYGAVGDGKAMNTVPFSKVKIPFLHAPPPPVAHHL